MSLAVSLNEFLVKYIIPQNKNAPEQGRVLTLALNCDQKLKPLLVVEAPGPPRPPQFAAAHRPAARRARGAAPRPRGGCDRPRRVRARAARPLSADASAARVL